MGDNSTLVAVDPLASSVIKLLEEASETEKHYPFLSASDVRAFHLLVSRGLLQTRRDFIVTCPGESGALYIKIYAIGDYGGETALEKHIDEYLQIARCPENWLIKRWIRNKTQRKFLEVKASSRFAWLTEVGQQEQQVLKLDPQLFKLRFINLADNVAAAGIIRDMGSTYHESYDKASQNGPGCSTVTNYIQENIYNTTNIYSEDSVVAPLLEELNQKVEKSNEKLDGIPAGVAEALEPSLSKLANGGKPQGKNRGLSTNNAMLEIITKDHSTVYWDLAAWAKKTKRKKSTVCGTNAWKQVCRPAQEERAREAEERLQGNSIDHTGSLSNKWLKENDINRMDRSED